MTRTNEAPAERKAAARLVKMELALSGGLEDAIGHSGGVLLGVSLKISEYDCLMTLRAEFPGGGMVAFVGGSGIKECFLKAMLASRRDLLRWKEDKYRANGG